MLQEAPVDILVPKSTFRVRVSEPSHSGSLYDLVAKADGVVGSEEYGSSGFRLTVTISCDLAVADQLKESLNDATRGGIEFLND